MDWAAKSAQALIKLDSNPPLLKFYPQNNNLMRESQMNISETSFTSEDNYLGAQSNFKIVPQNASESTSFNEGSPKD